MKKEEEEEDKTKKKGWRSVDKNLKMMYNYFTDFQVLMWLMQYLLFIMFANLEEEMRRRKKKKQQKEEEAEEEWEVKIELWK